jgi:osmotically-inducible protein OsmY
MQISGEKSMKATIESFAFANSQDQRIYDDVLRQLTWQPDIESNEVEVTVRGAVVFLKGKVPTCLEKREAEKAAKAPFGVVNVVNQLVVEPNISRSDEEIKADIVAALINVTSILDSIPEVEVDHGLVTLAGLVHWEFEKQRAENIALAIRGVGAVTNQIEVHNRHASAPSSLFPSPSPKGVSPRTSQLGIELRTA